MINIKKNGNIITIKGHSGYEESGKDIVCASISSIMFTTIGALYMFDENSFKYEKDDKEDINVTIEILKSDDVTNKLINNMMNAFKSVEADYKEYVNIESEEKL